MDQGVKGLFEEGAGPSSLSEEGVIQVSDPEFMPFSLEILLDLYFANPERLQRALGVRGTTLRTRMHTHFRRTFVRLLAGK
jgi:hypothetical protein